MAKFINNWLKEKLGDYLNGLENTQTSLGFTETTLHMTNV